MGWTQRSALATPRPMLTRSRPTAVREVTLYGLLSNLATQLVKNALQAQALYTAVGEVFSGLGENLGSQFGALREFLPQLPWQSRRRASSTQQEEDEE